MTFYVVGGLSIMCEKIACPYRESHFQTYDILRNEKYPQLLTMKEKSELYDYR